MGAAGRMPWIGMGLGRAARDPSSQMGITAAKVDPGCLDPSPGRSLRAPENGCYPVMRSESDRRLNGQLAILRRVFGFMILPFGRVEFLPHAAI